MLCNICDDGDDSDGYFYMTPLVVARTPILQRGSEPPAQHRHRFVRRMCVCRTASSGLRPAPRLDEKAGASSQVLVATVVRPVADDAA